MSSNHALDEIQLSVIDSRTIFCRCDVRELLMEGYLKILDWDIWDIGKQCRLRSVRRRARRLVRVCTFCLNYRKLRVKWNSLKLPFRTSFPAYTQRQLIHQCCQCFNYFLAKTDRLQFNPWMRTYQKPGPGVMKHFVMVNSAEHDFFQLLNLKLLTIANSFLRNIGVHENSLLIDMKMPSIVGFR